MNRSASKYGVVRGFHAQKAPYCQGKLVEALNEELYDVIVDARVDSRTFGTIGIYLLDPVVQNKLWVPRGFLHCFAVPFYAKSIAYFNYLCDNVYDKGSEFSINPLSIFEKLGNLEKDIVFPKDFSRILSNIDKMEFSEKDKAGLDYESWMSDIKNSKNIWYR